jgi:hypothetical protein
MDTITVILMAAKLVKHKEVKEECTWETITICSVGDLYSISPVFMVLTPVNCAIDQMPPN